MGDALERLKAKAQREAEKARKHATAIVLGYALLDEMDEKAGINSMVREILDRRLTVNRERSLFDLKPIVEERPPVLEKPEIPAMKLVKDGAAA